MVIKSSQGISNKGVKSTNVIKLDDFRPKEVPWPMSKQIMVGMRSDGYMILQALQPLLDEGYTLNITSGSDGNNIFVQLNKPKGVPYKHGEGPSFSVAMRRMSVGLSKQFTHMQE